MYFQADQSAFFDEKIGDSKLEAVIKGSSSIIEDALENGHYDDFDPKTDAWLININVQFTLYNQGIGTKLLQIFEDKCKEEGVRKIVGKFGPNVGRAKDLFRFYTRHGYTLRSNVNGTIIVLENLTENFWQLSQNPIFIEKVLITEEQ
jgi:GNAT superfamily N-acetyltransferase